MSRDKNQIEAFDKRKEHGTHEFKAYPFELWQMYKAWRTRRRDRPQYGWVYECGCKAWWGGNSLPYCAEHGLRLMRYKRK